MEEYTEQKKLAAAVNKIGININSICRRINSTGHFYQDDVDELKEKLDLARCCVEQSFPTGILLYCEQVY